MDSIEDLIKQLTCIKPDSNTVFKACFEKDIRYELPATINGKQRYYPFTFILKNKNSINIDLDSPEYIAIKKRNTNILCKKLNREIDIYTYYLCLGLLLAKLANNGYIVIRDSDNDTDSIDDGVDLLPLNDENNKNDCSEIKDEYSDYTKDYSYFLSEEKYKSIFRKNLCDENDFCYERDIKTIANVIHYFYSIIKILVNNNIKLKIYIVKYFDEYTILKDIKRKASKVRCVELGYKEQLKYIENLFKIDTKIDKKTIISFGDNILKELILKAFGVTNSMDHYLFLSISSYYFAAKFKLAEKLHLSITSMNRDDDEYSDDEYSDEDDDDENDEDN